MSKSEHTGNDGKKGAAPVPSDMDQIDPAEAASEAVPKAAPKDAKDQPKEGTTPNPFDPERWRRKAVPGGGARVQQLLTTVPVWPKPPTDKFVRVNPDPSYRMEPHIVTIKGEGDYLIAPEVEGVVAAHAGKLMFRVTLFTAITYAGDLFLWTVKFPASSNAAFARWPNSMREAAELAMTKWIRVESNTGIGAYVTTTAEGDLSEPAWRPEPFGQLLEIAFSGGKFVDRADHPLINTLRGLL
jgi:hypothetical protein